MKEITFGCVQVEKVKVQNSLHAAGNNDNLIIVSLVVKSVHPIDQVKSSKFYSFWFFQLNFPSPRQTFLTENIDSISSLESQL